MCRAKNGELLTNKNQVLARWKEHFEEHLNEGSESEQPTRSVNLRDDGVDIDLPSCEEFKGALKYLKNNNVLIKRVGNCSYFRERFSERWCHKRRYNHELGKEFNSPNALNVTKSSKLRYAGHMIRRPEDLPQKALFRAKPKGEIKED
jgi:hypothetical protein